MITEDENNPRRVAERIYREDNPEGKMDVPSYAYEFIERLHKRWLQEQAQPRSQPGTQTFYQWVREHHLKGVKKDADSEFKFESSAPLKQERPVADGDIRDVALSIRCLFEWSDKIVADHDPDTGYTEYKSGFVMRPLPNQCFIYDGQENTFFASAHREGGAQ